MEEILSQTPFVFAGPEDYTFSDYEMWVAIIGSIGFDLIFSIPFLMLSYYVFKKYSEFKLDYSLEFWIVTGVFMAAYLAFDIFVFTVQWIKLKDEIHVLYYLARKSSHLMVFIVVSAIIYGVILLTGLAISAEYL